LDYVYNCINSYYLHTYYKNKQKNLSWVWRILISFLITWNL
jgi:hypothetical protein